MPLFARNVAIAFLMKVRAQVGSKVRLAQLLVRIADSGEMAWESGPTVPLASSHSRSRSAPRLHQVEAQGSSMLCFLAARTLRKKRM